VFHWPNDVGRSLVFLHQLSFARLTRLEK